MKCSSRHSHSNSFIPISTSSSSHQLSFYPRTILSGTVFPNLFLITMTLLLLNILSLLSVTILSTTGTTPKIVASFYCDLKRFRHISQTKNIPSYENNISDPTKSFTSPLLVGSLGYEPREKDSKTGSI